MGRQLRNVTRVIETYNRTQGPVIRIRFDTDGGLQSLLSSLQGTMSLGLGGGLIGPLTQLAKLSFVPLAVSAAQAAGAIALLPAAIGGLAGAMAVLKMGMSGISDAFSAASAAAEAAEDSTGDLAHEAQLAAERAVALERVAEMRAGVEIELVDPLPRFARQHLAEGACWSGGFAHGRILHPSVLIVNCIFDVDINTT